MYPSSNPRSCNQGSTLCCAMISQYFRETSSRKIVGVTYTINDIWIQGENAPLLFNKQAVLVTLGLNLTLSLYVNLTSSSGVSPQHARNSACKWTRRPWPIQYQFPKQSCKKWHLRSSQPSSKFYRRQVIKVSLSRKGKF